MTGNSSRTIWHIAHWPPLAWAETVVKLLAIGFGLGALVIAIDEGNFELDTGLPLAQFIILGFLSLGLIAAIFDRVKEREVIAMEFVIVNNLGHWSMFAAIAASPGPGWHLLAFCSLFLGGDLVKLLFLKVHQFKVRDTPQSVLYGLTAAYAIGYTAVLILELLR